MIEDETFDSIDDALDIVDRGAEIMKKEPSAKPTKTSPKSLDKASKDCLLYTI